MATANSINANSTGVVGYDGAGTFSASTVTQHSILLGGSTTHSITNLGVASNGQLPIGSAGADPVLATLTAGTGITIANGAGSITINAAGGGFTWNVVTADVNPVVKNNGYIANKAGLITFTLPTTSAVGEMFAFTNLNTALGWTIVYGTGQSIRFGTSTTTTTSGSLSSINLGDTVYLLTVVANTTFFVVDSVGNITVA